MHSGVEETGFRARTGKIGRLSHEVREELNLRLMDGEPTERILAWVNSFAEVKGTLREQFRGEPINADNLSEWRLGGYEQWVNMRRRVETVRDCGAQLTDQDEAGARRVVMGLSKLRSIEMAELMRKVEELMQAKAREGSMDDFLKLAGAMKSWAAAVSGLRRGERESESMELKKRRAAVAERKLELKRAKIQKLTKDIETLEEMRKAEEKPLGRGFPPMEPHADGASPPPPSPPDEQKDQTPEERQAAIEEMRGKISEANPGLYATIQNHREESHRVMRDIEVKKRVGKLGKVTEGQRRRIEEEVRREFEEYYPGANGS